MSRVLPIFGTAFLLIAAVPVPDPGPPAQAGDRRGQGNTFYGEASVRLVLGDQQKALDACKRARQLFEDAGDRRGQGNTSLGEAGVRFRSGDNEKALETSRQAHELYKAAGHRLGEGLAFFGEANVLYFLSDYDQALVAYNRAASSSNTSGTAGARETC
jgi:tetratricopeptide (TPR) repeat protein